MVTPLPQSWRTVVKLAEKRADCSAARQLLASSIEGD
jgi:hypothetical protein